jgi:2-isopropylmalate synthase
MSAEEWGKKSGRYQQYATSFPVSLSDRTWPDKLITKAPIWCSVDLRDGNQALINPMDHKQKLEMFQLLVEIGFKEIEIGFPSAARVEFEFTRSLIEQNLIPDDVTPQVLTQARPHLIKKTFEAINGARRAIVHVYNSTSELQRRVVFRADKGAIKEIAVNAVRQIKELAEKTETEIVLEYSPESFTGTEIEYALEVCNAVTECWGPTPDNKLILNLPATVEMSTPNLHADQIEWFHRNLANRESVILSLHPHNDRGTGVAATELALMAGGDRVEGTLFGNGERTGNVDIVTLALNMFSQGVHPHLDLSDVKRVRELCERCTELPVPHRHPYAGELVFTAFSGSHQDAIKKGVKAFGEGSGDLWEVPYLPIDPADIGREYEPIIRINSQSGKGGVAYILESEFDCQMPKEMHPEFSQVIQSISDRSGKEVLSSDIWNAFTREYLECNKPYQFVNFLSASLIEDPDQVKCRLRMVVDGEEREVRGTGNGPIDACRKALLESGVPEFAIVDFEQHARSAGSDAEAVAYIRIENGGGKMRYGVGIDANTNKASIKALLSALNRAAAA